MFIDRVDGWTKVHVNLMKYITNYKKFRAIFVWLSFHFHEDITNIGLSAFYITNSY